MFVPARCPCGGPFGGPCGGLQRAPLGPAPGGLPPGARGGEALRAGVSGSAPRAILTHGSVRGPPQPKQ